jgi:hypothetical protein
MSTRGSERRQRTHRIEARLDEREYARVRREVHRTDLPMSEYVRRVLTGRRIVARADADAVAELGRLVDVLDATLAGPGGAGRASDVAPERVDALLDRVEHVLARIVATDTEDAR